MNISKSMDRSNLRVLMVHAEYVNTGGEESIVESEAALLEKYKHFVRRYHVRNREFLELGRVRGAIKTIWNHEQYRELRHVMRSERPDVVHFHNTFPSVSPAGYYAASAEGIPVVQSLHNFRSFCVNAFCFRNGSPCEDCLGKSIPWPGVVHSCHPRGRGVSATVASMIAVHRLTATPKRRVQVYINAATQFTRERLVEGGIPADRIVTKPNFLDPDPGPREGGGGYALFVGRLSNEKGIRTMLKAWKDVPEEIPLRILGSGPLEAEVAHRASSMPHVEYLGRRPLAEVVDAMGRAEALVFPSEWYEGMPRTIIESHAVGTPVIASNIGGIQEMVRDQKTGALFKCGDASSLASTARWFLAPELDRRRFRERSRAEFEEKYTAADNYQQLMKIYQQAIASMNSPIN